MAEGEEVRLEEAEKPGGAAEREREREENIQQNHANAPPTWVQHTLEIEDDQDKGSQASGQHHPADSVHPHHFQQRRLHGFVLPAGTGVSGRRARGAGAGTPRRGVEPGRRRAGLGGLERRLGQVWRPLSEPLAPGWGVEDAGVALEVPGCVDPPAARSDPPAPPRLPAAASAPAGGRCLLAGRAAGVRAVMVVPPPLPPPLRWPLWLSDRHPPSSPKATSLRSNDLYIPGLGFTKCNSQPPARGGRPRRAGRREGPERRGGASGSPRPCPGLGRVQLFPGECGVRAALPQGPKSPQSPAGWAAVWRLCQRFHDKTRRKKIRMKAPRCCHPLVPAFVRASGGSRWGTGRAQGSDGRR